jgi:hypothetical protein
MPPVDEVAPGGSASETTKPPAEMKAYRPQKICVAVSTDEFPAEEDTTGRVAKFKDQIGQGTGTLDLARLKVVAGSDFDIEAAVLEARGV